MLLECLQLAQAGTAGGKRPLVKYCVGDEPFLIKAARRAFDQLNFIADAKPRLTLVSGQEQVEPRQGGSDMKRRASTAARSRHPKGNPETVVEVLLILLHSM